MFWQLNPIWAWADAAPARREAPADLPRGHIPALDAIRGLAIVMVTWYRFGGGAAGPARAVESAAAVNWGMRGVDLFFVLSGFLITGILLEAKSRSHYFRNFYARRTLRIFPLYYTVLVGLWIASQLPVSADTPFQLAFANQGWLWYYGANVLQAWRGEWCLGPLDHFWSLAVEEHFYLVWPLVIYAVSGQTAKRICLALIAGSTLGRLAWLASGGNDVAIDVLTPLRMDGLALGGWLAITAREPGGMSRLVSLSRLAVLLTAPVVLALSFTEKRLLGTTHTVWSIFFGGLLVMVLTARPGTILERLGQSRWLQFFGKYSYGMYVFQCLLIPLLAPVLSAPKLAAWFGNPVAGQLVYAVIMFAVTTGVAIASWQLFERHFLAWKSLFEHRSTTATAPAA